MELFCCDIRGLAGMKSKFEKRGRSRISALGLSLLEHAVKRVWAAELPLIAKDAYGKPYFPSKPYWQFSISHAKTHILVAVSGYPVGADIETRRKISPIVIEKLMSPEEKEQFDFFDLWVLRESLFKLNEGGNLRDMHFKKTPDGIVAPLPKAQCRVYNDIPECAIAASCFNGSFPERVRVVPPKLICT